MLILVGNERRIIGSPHGRALSNNRLKPSVAAEKCVGPRGLAVTLDGLKPMVISVAIDYVLMGEANYYIVGKTIISVVLGGSGDLI